MSAKIFMFAALMGLCVSCAAHHMVMMTQSEYELICFGAEIDHVIARVGMPYEMDTLPDGTVIYRYIERFEVGPGAIAENVYTFAVNNGKVIDKKMESTAPPALRIRSP